VQTAHPGANLVVAVGEVFGIARRGRETSGYKFSAEVPDGVEYLSSERSTSNAFGGSPEVLEQFRCLRAGRFCILLAEGRPWETATPFGAVQISAS
jgi:hypothetical protein